MGFTMKVELPIFDLEKIDFCQTHPVFDGDRYIMVRDPRVAIAKDSISIKPLDNPGVFKKQLASVGQGGLSLTGGIPIWQNFYSCLVRGSCGSKRMGNDPTLETGMSMLADRMMRKYRDVHSSARYSFWLAFGIDPDTQLAIEDYYDTVTHEFAPPVDCAGDVDINFFP
jgi:hypothetical protein